MPIDILMPALSPTMEKGNLAKWLKNEGDKVKSGDIIAEIETDKATMEVEAVDEGILAKILVPAGSADVPVNQKIAILASEGEDPAAAAAGAAGVAAEPNVAMTQAHPDVVAASSPEPAAPAPAAPASPAIVSAQGYDSSGEIPAGTEMVTMTMREALRDAMAEEMRRDDNVFLIGDLDATVEQVAITTLRDHIFYAEVHLRVAEEVLSLIHI